jgi:CDP-4-dehydro-6-deoxyglucose reductase/ferredoxin-NAD(P)+ reductase (naphthalene dioxygenase ferredoxin-specific)
MYPRSFLAHLPVAGRTIHVGPDQTILAAALAAGVDYPHGCRSGRCGSCKSRLASGSVTLLPHSRFALSDQEKAAGLILACRATPQTEVTVTWNPVEETNGKSRRRIEGLVTSVRACE